MNPEAHWLVSLAELVSSRLLKDAVSKIEVGVDVKRKELDMVTRVHNPISRESDRWVPGTRWPAGSS